MSPTTLVLHRTLLSACVASVTLLVGAASAAAHVTVNPRTAEQGGFAELTFRVPTERDNAATTRLRVIFPAEQPLAFLSVKPHPGWSYQVRKAALREPLDVDGTQIREAVSSITWTTEGAEAAIQPGEYDEFSVSAGPLPEDDQMVFKAVQTYDSGEVVHWIEEAAAGAEEPEHPAPVLALTASTDDEQATGDAGGTDAADSGAGPEAPQRGVETAAHAGSDDAESGTAMWLSGAALIAALVAVSMAAVALRRRTAA